MRSTNGAKWVGARLVATVNARPDSRAAGTVAAIAPDDRGLPFTNRQEAGRALARLTAERIEERDDLVVLALPRGGVPVAFEVAEQLGAPLDVIVVRKLGVPSQPELAMGAVGEDGVRVLNLDVLGHLHISDRALQDVEARERAELARRARTYRGDYPRLPIDGCTVVVVDDGLATGSTARAAIEVARGHGARRVVLAVPVAPRETVAELSKVADDVVCVASPQPFAAIGQWYDDFRQTSDADVSRLLAAARARREDAT
jgi:putative phosphoribosyl transferase